MSVGTGEEELGAFSDHPHLCSLVLLFRLICDELKDLLTPCLVPLETRRGISGLATRNTTATRGTGLGVAFRTQAHIYVSAAPHVGAGVDRKKRTGGALQGHWPQGCPVLDGPLTSLPWGRGRRQGRCRMAFWPLSGPGW